MQKTPTIKERYENRAKFYLAKAYNVSVDKTEDQIFYIARRFIVQDLYESDRQLKLIQGVL